STPPTVNGTNQLVPAQNGNVNTKWVFEVTYTDGDNVAPGANGFVKVTLNNSLVIQLAKKNPNDTNFGAGVVYTSDPNGMTLTAGQKVFHFDAFDGLDAARFPAAPNSEIT